MKNHWRRMSLLLGLAFVLLASPGTPAWAQLATVDWPMFQHDLLHTGRAGVAGPSALNVKWTYQSVDWIKSQTAVGNGVLYFGSGFNPMCSVDSSGNFRWCAGSAGPANESTPAISSPGPIYEGDRANKMNSIDADGSVNWTYKIHLDGDIFSSSAIASDGTIYTACGCLTAGILHAFAPDTSAPNLKWTLQLGTGGIRNSSPAVVTEGGSRYIYIGSVNGWLRKVKDNGASGTLIWSLKVGTSLRDSSPSITTDGTTAGTVIYIGSNTGMSAVKGDGTLKWHLKTVGVVDTTAAIGANGRIYVSSYAAKKRTLYAIDPATAGSPGYTVAWTLQGTGGTTSQYSQTPSAVIDSNGIIYAAIGPTIYRLDSNGNQHGSFTVTPAADVISMSLGNGVLYFSAKNFLLYALAP